MKYFYHGRLNWDENSPSRLYVKEKCKRLVYHQILEEEDDGLLFDLIKKMLVYEPSKRLLLVDALEHRFFDKILRS